MGGCNIFLEGFRVDVLNTGGALKLFPLRLDKNRRVFEAGLVRMGCMEVMMYLHPFANEHLAGISPLSCVFL